MRQSKDSKKLRSPQGKKPPALKKVSAVSVVAKEVPRPILVCLGHLCHGENVRSSYRKEDIAELAASIQAKGLLQNLVGYTEGEQIAASAGHRRLEALLMLVSQNAVGHDGRVFNPDYEVPVLVKSKAEALEDSLIENLQREEMHPLDEARGFHRLATEYGYGPEEIAARTGKTLDSVKKRLHLATHLCEQGSKLFGDDQLTLTQAQALSTLPLNAQEKLLKQYGSGFDARLITTLLKGQTLEVSRAIFKLTDYRKAGGVVVEDLFKQIPPYFANPDIAKRLQIEAAEAQVERLKKKWAWARLVSEVNLWEYTGSNDKKAAGAIVVVDGRTLEVKIHEGLLERSKGRQSSAPQTTPRKRGPITKSGIVQTKMRKTAALQVALLHHTSSFHSALALSILGLLGNKEVFLGFRKDGDTRWEKLVVHPGVQAIFSEVAPKLGLGYKEGRLESPYLGDTAPLLGKLLGLPQNTLERLFTALSATAIGTWVGSHTESPADTPLALSLAGHLGAKVALTEMNDAWLKALSKERLMEVYRQMGGELAGEFTAKQLRGLVLERLKRCPEFLPTELTFHPRTQPRVMAGAVNPRTKGDAGEDPGHEEIPDEVLEEEVRRELAEELEDEYLEELEAA